MVELFVNNEDPDQTSHTVASDLGLHCLPVTRLRISSLSGLRKTICNRDHITLTIFCCQKGYF